VKYSGNKGFSGLGLSHRAIVKGPNLKLSRLNHFVNQQGEPMKIDRRNYQKGDIDRKRQA
jgi:hypothetical protein